MVLLGLEISPKVAVDDRAALASVEQFMHRWHRNIRVSESLGVNHPVGICNVTFGMEQGHHVPH